MNSREQDININIYRVAEQLTYYIKIKLNKDNKNCCLSRANIIWIEVSGLALAALMFMIKAVGLTQLSF